MAQIRHAFAQLFEYRFRCGDPEDTLCLVTNEPVSAWRVSSLEHHGIAVAYVESDAVYPCGVVAERLLTDVLSATAASASAHTG